MCVFWKVGKHLSLKPVLAADQYLGCDSQTQQGTLNMQADTRCNIHSTQTAAPQKDQVGAFWPRVIARHGSYDVTAALAYIQAAADGTHQAFTPGSLQGAASAIHASVSTLQAPNAHVLLAPWHGGPVPAAMPAALKHQPEPYHIWCDAVCLLCSHMSHSSLPPVPVYAANVKLLQLHCLLHAAQNSKVCTLWCLLCQLQECIEQCLSQVDGMYVAVMSVP